MSAIDLIDELRREIVELQALADQRLRERNAAAAREEYAYEQLDAAMEAAGFTGRNPKHFATHVRQLIADNATMRSTLERQW